MLSIYYRYLCEVHSSSIESTSRLGRIEEATSAFKADDSKQTKTKKDEKLFLPQNVTQQKINFSHHSFLLQNFFKTFWKQISEWRQKFYCGNLNNNLDQEFSINRDAAASRVQTAESFSKAVAMITFP